VYLRYLPPAANGKIDQAENIKLIENTTALRLPEKSRILVASNGEPRDRTKGFFYWLVFSEERSIRLK
jgi:hypothetical protein